MSDARFAIYLGQLAERLDGTPRDNARALDEIAAHLSDVAAAEAAAGHAPDEAAARAIARVGSVEAVAARFAAEVDDPRALRIGLRVGRLAMTWLMLAGLAGFLAEPIAWLVGRDFFVGDERFVAVTPERCLELMKLHRLNECNAALMEDHFGELVQFGLAAAILALVALWGLRAILRRIDPMRGRARLDAWSARAGAALFFTLALIDLVHALRSIAGDPHNGGGRALVGGLVAAAAAVVFATRLRLRRQTT